jgi:long-chain fatty acid transport protein
MGDTSKANCGIAGGPNTCGGGNNLHVNVPEPMEVKIGFRYHKRRSDVPYNEHVRDPMAQDVFDVEADLTWANNSTFQTLGVTLPGNATTGAGVIPINGLQNIGGTAAPQNDNIPHGFKDVYGIRVGSDVNVIPDEWAIRGGGFLQSNGQNPQYQDIDFPGTMNGGLTIGTTYRIHLSKEKANALEISLGYEHVFYVRSINDGPNGLDAIAGTPCAQGETASGLNCTVNGKVVGQTYRSPWPINLGIISNSINVLNVGLGYKF